MDAPPRRLVLVLGGKPRTAAVARPRARGKLRVIEGGAGAELEQALAEAVEAARQMRLEIERRIARALEAFDDRR
jgi:hypothetical protein